MVIINPRINFDDSLSRVNSLVSCSTGWSIQWRNGLLGLYSFDTATHLLSSLYSDKQGGRRKPSRPFGYVVYMDKILVNCK